MPARRAIAFVVALTTGCGRIAADAPNDAVADDAGTMEETVTVTDDSTVDDFRDLDAPTPTDTAAVETEGTTDTSPISDAPATDDVVAVADGGTMGWTWKPIGGPEYSPVVPYAVVASGEETLLVETPLDSHGRTFRRTGTSWDVASYLPLGGGAASARPAGGFVETTAASIWALSGATWSRLADCPDRLCGAGIPLESASGALFLVDASGIRRRPVMGGAWTTVSPLAAGVSPGRPTAVGTRIHAGGMVSTDDGLTWKSLTSEIPYAGYRFRGAVATTAGTIVWTGVDATGDAIVSLRSDSGSWTKVLLDVHPYSLAAFGSRVFVTGSDVTYTGRLLARSLDGGATWTSKAGTPALDLRSISSSRVLASNGTDNLMSSTDDGETFVPIARPPAHFADAFTYRPTTTPELWAARFYSADGSRAARVGPSRSTDGGSNWTSLGECGAGGGAGDSPQARRPFLFTLPKSLDVFAGGDMQVQRFDETTKSWVVLGPTFGTKPGGPLATDGTRLLAWGTRSLSTDFGLTWGAGGDRGGGGGFDATGRAWSFGVYPFPLDIRESAAGTSWTAFTAKLPPNSWHSFVGRDGTLYATSSPMLYPGPPVTMMRSIDGGETWSPIATTSYPGAAAVLPIGAKSTLVLLQRTIDALGDARIAVMLSDDGGSTFVNRTFDLPQAEPIERSGPSDHTTFFEGDGHVWASLPNYGLFELVPTP